MLMLDARAADCSVADPGFHFGQIGTAPPLSSSSYLWVWYPQGSRCHCVQRLLCKRPLPPHVTRRGGTSPQKHSLLASLSMRGVSRCIGALYMKVRGSIFHSALLHTGTTGHQV